MSSEYLDPTTVVGTPWWDQLIYLIGEVTVVVLILMIIVPVIVTIIVFLSIHNRHFYAPRFLKAGLVMSEGMSKATCRFLGWKIRN